MLLFNLIATSVLARPFDVVDDPVLSLDDAFGRRRYDSYWRYARDVVSADAEDKEKIELENEIDTADDEEVEDAVDQIEESMEETVDEDDLKKNGVDLDKPEEVKAQMDKCIEVGKKLDEKKDQRRARAIQRARAESTGPVQQRMNGGAMDEEKERIWGSLISAGANLVGNLFGRRRFSDEWLYRARRAARFEEEELAIERKLEAEVEKCNEFNAAMEQDKDIENQVIDATEEANEEEAGEVTEDEDAVAETVGKCTKLDQEIKEVMAKRRRAVEEWAWERRARGEHISDARIEEEMNARGFDWWGAIKGVADSVSKAISRGSEWDNMPREAREAGVREEMLKLFAECNNLDGKMEDNPETMEKVKEIAEDKEDEMVDAADKMENCIDADGDGSCDDDDDDDSSYDDSDDRRSVRDWRQARSLSSKLERLLRESRY